MKKLILTAMMILYFVSLAHAIDLKQGFIYSWGDRTIKNLTTVETMKTKPIESIGKWNALWDGWSLDAGFAYDGDSLNTTAL